MQCILYSVSDKIPNAPNLFNRINNVARNFHKYLIRLWTEYKRFTKFLRKMYQCWMGEIAMIANSSQHREPKPAIILNSHMKHLTFLILFEHHMSWIIKPISKICTLCITIGIDTSCIQHCQWWFALKTIWSLCLCMFMVLPEQNEREFSYFLFFFIVLLWLPIENHRYVYLISFVLSWFSTFLITKGCTKPKRKIELNWDKAFSIYGQNKDQPLISEIYYFSIVFSSCFHFDIW